MIHLHSPSSSSPSSHGSDSGSSGDGTMQNARYEYEYEEMDDFESGGGERPVFSKVELQSEYIVHMASNDIILYVVSNLGRLFALDPAGTHTRFKLVRLPVSHLPRYRFVVKKLFAGNLGMAVILQLEHRPFRNQHVIDNHYGSGSGGGSAGDDDELEVQNRKWTKRLQKMGHYHKSWTSFSFDDVGVDAEDSIVDVALTMASTMVVMASGRVFVEGTNLKGMLGDKSSLYQIGGFTFREWREYPSETNPTNPASTDRFVSARMGDTHTLMITALGSVYTIGRDFVGLLTREKMFDDSSPRLERYLSSIVSVTCSASATNAGLQSTQRVPYYEQLPQAYHNMALTESGSVFAWGFNRLGQLGISFDRDQLIFPTLIESLYGQKVIQLASGYQTSACIAEPSIETFENLLNSELFCDIDFEIGDDVTIHAHKCILLARCPVLLALIECNLLGRLLSYVLVESEEHVADFHVGEEGDRTIVRLSSQVISRELLLLFLQYLYTDNIVSTEDNISKVNQNVKSLLNMAKLFHYLEYINNTTQEEEEKPQLSRAYVSSLARAISEQFASLPLRNVVDQVAKAFSDIDSNPLFNFGSRCARLIGCCSSMSNLADNIMRNPPDNTFGNHMISIFDKEDCYSDWTMVVQNPTKGTSKILVHKVILATKMDFFKAVLTGGHFMSESDTNTFEINPEFKSHTIIPMLAYAYSENSALLDENNACESLICADFFSYLPYKKVVEHEIASYLDDVTIFPLLNVCAYNNAFFLREQCFIYMIDHFERLSADKQYQKIPSELKEAIEKRASKSGKSKTTATTTTVPNLTTTTAPPQPAITYAQPEPARLPSTAEFVRYLVRYIFKK